MNRSFILTAIFVTVMATFAIAEVNDNLSNDFKEEFGPNLCSKSLELVHVWLKHPGGTETHFKIPKAYFSNNWAHDGGEQDIITLRVMRDDFSPACSSPLLYKHMNDGKRLGEILTSITVDGVGILKKQQAWSNYYDERYTDYIKTDGMGFKIYEQKRTQNKEEGYSYKEYLIPPDKIFNNPSYVICSNSVLQGKYARGGCNVTQYYHHNLKINYSFRSNQFGDLAELDRKVNKLISQFIINPAKESVDP